ncbi:MAG: PQQ-binding-like beta-propeller repeat protein [Candidatus Brocadiia bacterium]
MDPRHGFARAARWRATLAWLLACTVSASAAAQWPQFHGPGRTNRSPETGLLDRWPEGGPPRVWTARGIGFGFSTVSIADGRITTTGNIRDHTVITAMDMDGKHLWQANNGPAYKRSHPGTRSTPTIDEGRLYHENADGDVVCLDAATGERRWGRNILEKFGGRNITWALAESLLVDGDRVVCTPGGEEISLAALDKATGETVWTCRGANDKPGYCSPIVFEHRGLRQIVTLMAKSVVGVHAQTGKLLWQVPHETPFDENITTPIFHDGHVFVSTRTTGSKLLRLEVEGQSCQAEVAWSTEAMDSQHEGVLLLDGYLYATCLTARPGPWVCLEWASGKRAWGERGIGRASITWAEGMIYAVNFKGVAALVRPSPRGFQAVSQFRIPEGGRGPVWAHPVVCGGRLYIRHADYLFCYDVRAR